MSEWGKLLMNSHYWWYKWGVAPIFSVFFNGESRRVCIRCGYGDKPHFWIRKEKTKKGITKLKAMFSSANLIGKKN